jgi:hypothetical protein
MSTQHTYSTFGHGLRLASFRGARRSAKREAGEPGIRMRTPSLLLDSGPARFDRVPE